MTTNHRAEKNAMLYCNTHAIYSKVHREFIFNVKYNCLVKLHNYANEKEKEKREQIQVSQQFKGMMGMMRRDK